MQHVSAVAWIVRRDARGTFALRSIAVWAALVTVAGLFIAPSTRRVPGFYNA